MTMSQIAVSISDSSREPKPVARKSGFIGHVKIISILTLFSRILAMGRESVVATFFGAGVVSSAFTAAFKVPNLFRKLLGEGALSAAFIPLYAQALKQDEAEANSFAAASVNLLAMILIGLTIFGELCLWAAVKFVGLRPDELLIARFTAIMLPYVFLICGTAFLGAILQVHHRFALPAAAPVLLNVMHIAVIVIGAKMLLLTHATGERQILLQTRLAYWLSGFVLVAGVMQIGMLLPSLRAVGFRFGKITDFWSPMVARMLRLSIPVALSAGVLQLSVVVDTLITVVLTRGENPADRLHLFGHVLNYPLQLGAVARLNWAQLLYQFPLGVFAISLATAIFPSLSSDAVDRDRQKFRRVLRQGILFALLEGLPASIGLVLVRYPTVRLLFERGNFTSFDTWWVTRSLIFYAAGIWAFSVQQILNRAYYAMHDMTTPLVLSVVTMAVNTAVEIPLAFTHLGEAGLAAGTLASFAIQAVVMLIMLDRKVGGLGLARMAGSIAKMLLACGVMTAACLGLQNSGFLPKGSGHLASLEQLAALLTVGGISYAAVCWWLGLMHEFRHPGQSASGEDHSDDDGDGQSNRLTEGRGHVPASD
jgi:putative peptidoglycan lipid II flippase